MTRFHIYLFLTAALFIHLTVLRYVTAWGARPDLMLIIVIFSALYMDAGAGLETGVACGLLKDLFALDYLGINTLIFAFAGVFIGMIKEGLFRESKVTQFILVFASTSITMILHYSLVLCFSRNISFTLMEFIRSSVLRVSLYTAIVALPVFSRLQDMYGLSEAEGLL